eukprot:534651_1
MVQNQSVEWNINDKEEARKINTLITLIKQKQNPRQNQIEEEKTDDKSEHISQYGISLFNYFCDKRTQICIQNFESLPQSLKAALFFDSNKFSLVPLTTLFVHSKEIVLNALEIQEMTANASNYIKDVKRFITSHKTLANNVEKISFKSKQCSDLEKKSILHNVVQTYSKLVNKYKWRVTYQFSTDNSHELTFVNNLQRNVENKWNDVSGVHIINKKNQIKALKQSLKLCLEQPAISKNGKDKGFITFIQCYLNGSHLSKIFQKYEIDIISNVTDLASVLTVAILLYKAKTFQINSNQSEQDISKQEIQSIGKYLATWIATKYNNQLQVTAGTFQKNMHVCLRAFIDANPATIQDILHEDPLKYMSLQQRNSIKIYDKIDYRNEEGKFMGYTVLDKRGTILTLFQNEAKFFAFKDIDYMEQNNELADYGSISRRKAHRLLDVVMGDYVDINKDGWRYGEIIDIDEFTGHVQVSFFDNDGYYDEYWFHLDNVREIAKCNSKCNIVTALKKHVYDPFFNIKKHKNEGKLMMQRLTECFTLIETEILPEKIKQGRIALVSYLNDVYQQLYVESIAFKMKEGISNDDMKNMKELFLKKYNPLVELLKIETDSMHLWLKPQDLMIDVESEKKRDVDSDLDKKEKKKLQEIKVKWNLRMFDMKCTDDQRCEEYTCMSIKRINYILDLFEEYYILSNIEQDSTSIEMKKPDFIILYNKCIRVHYSTAQLLDDFHHLQAYHEENILKDCNIINKCKIKECKLNQVNTYPKIEYKELHEVQVIENIIKMHVFFQHKKKMKNSDISSISTDIRATNTLNRRMIKKPTKSIFEMEVKKQEKCVQHTIPVWPRFELGQRFYYTKHFQDYDNYIEKQKYGSLIEEFLSNRIHRTRVSMLGAYLWKAVHHSIYANQARQLKSKYYGVDNQRFEIPPNLPITMSHILCIICYTDDDRIQKRYKKYGCRLNEYANDMIALKELNAEIAWWYCLLYEAVLFYGTNVTTNDVFYYGLSVKLLFEQITPVFGCPFSTTLSFDISLRFGLDGVILELKPLHSSQDRYLNVEWISAFPKEKERLFCQAHGLYIHDIRFKEKGECVRESSTSNQVDISALRLFDYIVNKNLEAPAELFNKQNQAKLSKYFHNQTKILKMDAVQEFVNTNGLCTLSELFTAEDYDSECIDIDLIESEESGFIREYCTDDKDEDKINRLVDFIDEYDRENASIPIYLRKLFGFMIEQLTEKLQKKKALHMLKSQYTKLNIDLQLKVMELLCKHDIEYTEEFEWRIEADELRTPIQGITHDRSESFEFKYIDAENKTQAISFIPKITTINPSWPKYCSIGISVRNVSCNTASFYWSFAVKEIDYSCDVEIYIKNAKNGTYNGTKAFKNTKLKGLKNCLTVTIYMRRDIS